jgi:hypothetical protein
MSKRENIEEQVRRSREALEKLQPAIDTFVEELHADANQRLLEITRRTNEALEKSDNDIQQQLNFFQWKSNLQSTANSSIMTIGMDSFTNRPEYAEKLKSSLEKTIQLLDSDFYTLTDQQKQEVRKMINAWCEKLKSKILVFTFLPNIIDRLELTISE